MNKGVFMNCLGNFLIHFSSYCFLLLELKNLINVRSLGKMNKNVHGSSFSVIEGAFASCQTAKKWFS